MFPRLSLLQQLLLLLLLSSYFQLPVTGQANSLESVPDLEKAMYLIIEGYPCVRLLNLSGEIGCSNPDHRKVAAPIIRFHNADDQLFRQSTLLISADEMQNFFNRVSNDQNFAKNVAGVLVESVDAYQVQPLGFSPVEKFPQSDFSPYQNHSYEWNPTGSGIMWNRYNFPVFLLSWNSTLIVQEIVSKNDKDKKVYPANVAEFALVMQTTKVGTHDSESCLKEKSCLPLGGHSVWSSLPPINVTSLKAPKPHILVIASQDSASFFRDQSLGADSPISGMISLLAVVDALSHISSLGELKKQLVFMVFTGEAWGYLGSRRFLAELDIGGNAVKGLDNKLIEQVLEIGSVGKGFSEGVTTFFAHAEGDSSTSKDIISAFKRASDSLLSENIKMKNASTSNPGVPPSSLMSFLRKNSSISGLVLEDFDSVFANKFYHSHLDNSSNINSSSIAASASLVARALYILAHGDSQPNLGVLKSIKVNMSLVDKLVGCLLTCNPGLSCDLVKSFISPSGVCPNHYVGVFLGSPYDTYDYIDDTSRFVWNFLADRTSIPKDSMNSTCSERCSNSGEVCIARETDSKGRCAISSTRYIPTYSTRLKFEGGSWHVMPINASDPMGLVDPVWTESFWDTIGLKVYRAQSSAFDNLVLLGGVTITVAAYIAVLIVRSFLMKAVKHD